MKTKIDSIDTTEPNSKNSFILQTSKDYDITYEAVEVYYNKYGNSKLFYEKLEEHLKTRSF